MYLRNMCGHSAEMHREITHSNLILYTLWWHHQPQVKGEHRMISQRHWIFGLGLVLVAPTNAVLADQPAGVAAAVQGTVTVSNAKEAVTAQSGMDILTGDQVASEPASRMQILLRDETVFTVGPDSAVTIDEFVYDPKQGTGKIVANYSKGVFRYVSGRIGKVAPENIELRLPVGTIGIRGTQLFVAPNPETGGTFIGLLGPGPNNNAQLNAGGFSFSDGTKVVEVSRAGYGVEVTPGLGLSSAIPTPPSVQVAFARSLGAQAAQADIEARAAQPTPQKQPAGQKPDPAQQRDEGNKQAAPGPQGPDNANRSRNLPPQMQQPARQLSGQARAEGFQPNGNNPNDANPAVRNVLGNLADNAANQQAAAIFPKLDKFETLKNIPSGTVTFGQGNVPIVAGNPLAGLGDDVNEATLLAAQRNFSAAQNNGGQIGNHAAIIVVNFATKNVSYKANSINIPAAGIFNQDASNFNVANYSTLNGNAFLTENKFTNATVTTASGATLNVKPVVGFIDNTNAAVHSISIETLSGNDVATSLGIANKGN